jgi:hypothetical protein
MEVVAEVPGTVTVDRRASVTAVSSPRYPQGVKTLKRQILSRWTPTSSGKTKRINLRDYIRISIGNFRTTDHRSQASQNRNLLERTELVRYLEPPMSPSHLAIILAQSQQRTPAYIFR